MAISNIISIVNSGNSKNKRKFFRLEPNIPENWGRQIDIANADRLMAPGLDFLSPPIERTAIYKKWSSFGYFKEKPKILEKKGRRLFRDMESYGSFWLISQRLKHIFERTDPQGFVFAACDFMQADGSRGAPYFLCDVVRTIDALDEEKSRLWIETRKNRETGEEDKRYIFSNFSNAVFRENRIRSAHIFRTPYAPVVFCDDALRDACCGENLTGLLFVSAENL
ncbi:imm11 family protein [Nitratireductor indicus]|uniref:imm11 family protein n=1 Tax=Nitratireductor indicus TaxID=721133 RepID=UPI0028742F59|nr:DUF1629 domain-containing protein [Nitratireductor indicus]MDS1138634.1 DUF1629 domain-containing protein [Nitratireductor indicus]